MVINSCQCDEEKQEKGPAAFAAVTQYLNSGGRMFNTHYSYDFLKFSPDPMLASEVVPAVRATPHTIPQSWPGPAVIIPSFPKAQALADWIKFLDPSLPFRQVPIQDAFGNLTGANAQVWALDIARRPLFVTMNTPLAAQPDQQCGRLVDMDTHVTDEEKPMVTDLAQCEKTLNKAENVLAFMLFDLAACIQEDTRPPAPPPLIQ
jgi:hypothetical protein